MDGKALAKSKRAHSLHNKKKHQSHHGLKGPSVVSDNKKPAGKQAKGGVEESHVQQTKEKTPQHQVSKALPSNWDRYDEDFGLGSEGAQASSSQPTEYVMPRSKGSDYTHLISEAKAQSQSHYSSDVSTLFDDFVGDFTQDFGPMLTAKGQSMLSWTTDDSFEFEGKANISTEAPFLSLNLNALAIQLSKAKLSERLYLQSDLLPLELLDEASNEDKIDPQTHTSAAETNSLTSSLSYDQTVTATGDVLVQTSEGKSDPFTKYTGEITQLREMKPGPGHPTDPSSTFEAASAEAELDMLLNSFSDSTDLESSGTSMAGVASSADVSGESMKKGSSLINPANADDAIDILLEDTLSFSVADQQKSHALKTENESIISSSNNPSSKIGVDDFDSWLDTI